MGCDKISTEVLREWLVTQVARETNRPVEKIDIHKTFARLGLDSVAQLSITGDLSEWLQRDLPTTVLQEYPTLAAVAEHLAQECADVPAKSQPLVPRNQWLPVTLAQESVLKHANFDARGDGNILTGSLSIRGRLDVGALRGALSEIMRRHEVLRTTFSKEGERFVHWVHPPVPAELQEYDLTATEHPEEETAALAIRLVGESMNLHAGPLFRAQLFHVGAEDYRVQFSFHHVLADAGALDIFYTELGHFYERCRGGTPSTTPGPVMQMAELAALERQSLEKSGAPYQEQMAWWHEYWGGLSYLTLKLPALWKERPGVVPEPKDCRFFVEIPRALVGHARELAITEAATPYLVWFAAFAAFLHQETGRKDFVLGTYVSQHKTTAAQRSIGMFTTMVPVRICITEPWTFRELLARVVEEMNQVALHQELPFEDLCQSLSAAGKLAPDVKVIFNYVHEPADSCHLLDLETGPWDVVQTTLMPWGFIMRLMETNGRLFCNPGCDGNLYDPAEMRRMVERYIALLEALLVNPEEQATLLQNQSVPDLTAPLELW